MADIINLNRVRKAKTKQQEQRQAEINRVAFGRTKAEKAADKARQEQDKSHLDGHRLDPSD